MHAKTMILEQLPAATRDTSQSKPLLIASSENRGPGRPSSQVLFIKNKDQEKRQEKRREETRISTRDLANCARRPKIDDMRIANCARHPKVDLII